MKSTRTGSYRLRQAAGRPIVRRSRLSRGDGAPATWTRAMERNLFKYIWRHSWRDQVYILVIVALLQVFYFISLDLPKRIVNDGIRGDAFKKADVHTLPFMHVSVGPYPSIGLPEVTLFGGIPLDQMQYL